VEDFIRLLKTLSEARGPSGFEDEVRGVVIRGMEPYVDEVVDRWVTSSASGGETRTTGPWWRHIWTR
jgi:putative aminopeptidase FrvX